MRSAPPSSTSRTCSPSRAKSADRIEGAIAIIGVSACQKKVSGTFVGKLEASLRASQQRFLTPFSGFFLFLLRARFHQLGRGGWRLGNRGVEDELLLALGPVAHYDRELVLAGEGAAEQALGEGVFAQMLDGPAPRPGPGLDVAALLEGQVPGFVGQHP